VHKFLTMLALSLSALMAQAQDNKVVYHLTTGIDTTAGALSNIQNHLSADPKVKIVVVTNGPGVNFLVSGSKDSKGREFSGAVSELAGRGVEFRVCNNSLLAYNIDPNQLLMETTLVPSGVAEVARLQIKEHFAYIKP